MMPRQYKPFTLYINKIPLIVYPVKDENPLQEIFQNENDIQENLKKLYSKNRSLLTGNYHILFVWNLEGERMTDVWVHNMENWSDSGPLIECYTFRGLKQCDDAGIASGDSIIALAREEELRRQCASMEKFVDRSKVQPEFPDGMQPDEIFGN